MKQNTRASQFEGIDQRICGQSKTKELMRGYMRKDCAKELESRRSAPSVVAKLMGLDVLPPPRTPPRTLNQTPPRTPPRLPINIRQEFKDVYEVSDSFNTVKAASQFLETPGSVIFGTDKNGLSFAGRSFPKRKTGIYEQSSDHFSDIVVLEPSSRKTESPASISKQHGLFHFPVFSKEDIDSNEHIGVNLVNRHSWMNQEYAIRANNLFSCSLKDDTSVWHSEFQKDRKKAEGSRSLKEMFDLSNSEKFRYYQNPLAKEKDLRKAGTKESFYIVLPKCLPCDATAELSDAHIREVNVFRNRKFEVGTFLEPDNRNPRMLYSEDDDHVQQSTSSACCSTKVDKLPSYCKKGTSSHKHHDGRSVSRIPKEFEQLSPVSILEPQKDEECSSSEFRRQLIADVPDLQRHINLAQTQEEPEFYTSSDDESGVDSLEAFLEEKDRDFSYLLDMLIYSGVNIATDLGNLLDMLHFSDTPVAPHVFLKLERKYSKIGTWTRSERRLLFDLVNSVLSRVLLPFVHPMQSSRSPAMPAWGPEGPVEKVWLTLVRQRKELAAGNADDTILDPCWPGRDGCVLIGQHIWRMLIDNLLDEAVLELLAL